MMVGGEGRRARGAARRRLGEVGIGGWRRVMWVWGIWMLG